MRLETSANRRFGLFTSNVIRVSVLIGRVERLMASRHSETVSSRREIEAPRIGLPSTSSARTGAPALIERKDVRLGRQVGGRGLSKGNVESRPRRWSSVMSGCFWRKRARCASQGTDIAKKVSEKLQPSNIHEKDVWRLADLEKSKESEVRDCRLLRTL
jgi:hypothetical protein